jgi:hypothetical protein
VDKADQRCFLKFNFLYELPNENKKDKNHFHRILLWAHPNLLFMLRHQGIHTYVDATFHSVPRPFTQCIVLMVSDDETDLFVPIVYLLVDAKAAWTYWNFFNLVLIMTETKFDPSMITCDFEKALMQSIA